MIKMQLLFFIVQAIALAQSPKKANTAVVSGVNYSNAIKALMDQGYYISKSDSLAGYIYTELRQLKGLDAFGALRVRISDGSIIIQGEMKVPLIGDNFFQTENAGMSGSPAKKAWLLIENYATSFNKPVQYIRK